MLSSMPVPDVHVSERTVLVWLAGDNISSIIVGIA